MVKRILKRYASLLMIAALVLTTIPIIVFPAFAASTSGTVTGLSDANIGLSFNGEVEDPWTAAGTTITGSATNATTCENNPKKESKLTIKNKSSSVAKLIFKYDVTLNSGSVTIDGTTVTSAGTFSKEIGAGGSIIVAVIVVIVVKNRYKHNGKAGTYDLKKNSKTMLTDKKDIFLTKHVSVTRIRSDSDSSGGSSSSSSGGGGSSGGGSRSF